MEWPFSTNYENRPPSSTHYFQVRFIRAKCTHNTPQVSAVYVIYQQKLWTNICEQNVKIIGHYGTLLYLDIGSMGFYGSVWEWGLNHQLHDVSSGFGEHVRKKNPYSQILVGSPRLLAEFPFSISWILVFNMNKHGFNHSIHWPPCFC